MQDCVSVSSRSVLVNILRDDHLCAYSTPRWSKKVPIFFSDAICPLNNHSAWILYHWKSSHIIALSPNFLCKMASFSLRERLVRHYDRCHTYTPATRYCTLSWKIAIISHRPQQRDVWGIILWIKDKPDILILVKKCECGMKSCCVQLTFPITEFCTHSCHLVFWNASISCLLLNGFPTCISSIWETYRMPVWCVELARLETLCVGFLEKTKLKCR